MAKQKAKKSRRSVHEEYDLPAEVDFGKTRFRGMGLKALQHGNGVKVSLDADVVEAFPNEQAVNAALRAVIKMRQTLLDITADTAKRRKSA